MVDCLSQTRQSGDKGEEGGKDSVLWRPETNPQKLEQGLKSRDVDEMSLCPQYISQNFIPPQPLHII